ncbi:uncharacterized protein LOC142377936 isoform X1 [Odontesthes bonariensis]|uniref:uncharacterized protein LOC142377936 isoform X1 n=2 Tax=Odontesthes bonariensis TaxID=219752 RepID=UPI003F580B28
MEGWLELTCKYPEKDKIYITIRVNSSKTASRQSSQTNEWESKDRFFLYHNIKYKNLRLTMKQLKQKDRGQHHCEFNQSRSHSTKDGIILDAKECQMSFYQTAHRRVKTTIPCDYFNKYNLNMSEVEFICKENNFICKEMSIKSPQTSNGTLTNTSSGFSLSISDGPQQDPGVYWCGVKEKYGNYRTEVMKTNLKVKDFTNFKKSAKVGQDLTYFCKYFGNVSTKFICKGEDPSTCQLCVNTTKPDSTRFAMKDNITQEKITITLRKLAPADSGTYWCGAESVDKQQSIFFHIMVLNVSTSSEAAFGGFEALKALIISVAVLALLLFIIVSILIYNRFLLLKSTRNRAEEQHPREDHIYEEIREVLQIPDSESSITNIDTIASIPIYNPSPLHYSTINFESRTANRPNGGALIQPTCHSTTAMEIPLYSMIQPHQTDDNDDDDDDESLDCIGMRSSIIQTQ